MLSFLAFLFFSSFIFITKYLYLKEGKAAYANQKLAKGEDKIREVFRR